jgi:hypothetical protein
VASSEATFAAAPGVALATKFADACSDSTNCGGSARACPASTSVTVPGHRRDSGQRHLKNGDWHRDAWRDDGISAHSRFALNSPRICNARDSASKCTRRSRPQVSGESGQQQQTIAATGAEPGFGIGIRIRSFLIQFRIERSKCVLNAF